MTLEQIVNHLKVDTFGSASNWGSLELFRPELILCAAIVLILLLRVIGLTSRIDSFYVALFGVVAALWFSFPPNAMKPMLGGTDEMVQRLPAFTEMLAYDGFSVFVRAAVMLFAVLFCIFTRISGIPDKEAAPDVYVLVLGATLGMCIMATANHLLMIFLGVEMASVPSYALAGLLKGRRQSSEAALKYAVYGAGTAGVMLYGISLIAGLLNSAHLPSMAVRLADLLAAPDPTGGTRLVLALGALMVFVGLAFKLSAVPFHFWCPDVFEGATAEVNAFLSVASKAAALGLLVRVALAFSYIPSNLASVPVAAETAAQADSAVSAAEIAAGKPRVILASLNKADEPDSEKASATEASAASDSNNEPSDKNAAGAANETTGAPGEAFKGPRDDVQFFATGRDFKLVLASHRLAPVRDFLAKLLAFIAVITCTFGNLTAYGQTNIKRLLAYSTIAHAGYMIMPVAAALVLVETNPTGAEAAIAALAFYIGVYLFMNLGAFAVVAFIRNTLRTEEVADYAGLIRRMPIITVCFGIMLVSLIGLPPMAGFPGKLLIFSALVDAGKLASWPWTVLVIAGLNTAISLFFYLRVLKVMTFEPEPDNRLPVSLGLVPGTFIVALTLPVFFWGIWWDNLNQWAQAAAVHLF